MDDFPIDIVIGLCIVLAGTLYVIAYILRLAYMEMQDEEPSDHSVRDKSGD